jgi:simple sugar transport system permease protein
MLRLEKRPSPSQTWAYLAPVLAVIATMIGGGVMFALLGKDPFEAIRIIL